MKNIAIIAAIMTALMLIPAVGAIPAPKEWTLRVDAQADDGYTYCLLGEKKGASDSVDQFDIPHPPFFPPGRAFIFMSEPSFPMPYNNVWMEWKHFPGTQKEFNMTTFYYPDDDLGAYVILTWQKSLLQPSEYRYVYLTLDGTTLLDMKKTGTYTFWSEPYAFTHFKVICVYWFSPLTKIGTRWN